MQCWILTFARPAALTRQILTWGRAGYDVNVFSNHPTVSVETNEALDILHGGTTVHYNSLSYEDSNSWCARSWNSIFIKAFVINGQQEAVFVQDDTAVHPNFPEYLKNFSHLDFIFGPGGDQFFYMKKRVLQRVGWFDERFFGCYCGDCDWLLRVWQNYKKTEELDKLSIEETHSWGWIHNPIGMREAIPTGIQSKAIDPTYVNQHEETEAKFKTGNRVLEHSQKHFRNKWGFQGGNGIDGIGPLNEKLTDSLPLIEDYDWYPWATDKLNKKKEIPWISSVSI